MYEADPKAGAVDQAQRESVQMVGGPYDGLALNCAPTLSEHIAETGKHVFDTWWDAGACKGTFVKRSGRMKVQGRAHIYERVKRPGKPDIFRHDRIEDA